MPSPIAHTLGAYAALIAVQPSVLQDRNRNSILLGQAFVFGTLADADFILDYALNRHPVWRHHFFSHSFPFAFFVGVVAWVILLLWRHRTALKTSLLITLAYSTHLILDYLTEDGSYPRGIPLLWPFTDTHYMAPVLIFYSIHRGGWEDLLSPHNLLAILMEVAVLGPVVFLVCWLIFKRHQKVSP